MNSKWFDLVGLIFALSGAMILAWGLITSRKQALKIGVSRMAEDSDDKNICLPHVRDEMRESKFALVGAVLMVIGSTANHRDAVSMNCDGFAPIALLVI